MTPLLPRRTLSAGAILRWHIVRRWFPGLADPARPVRLLDVGCGRGEFVFELARVFWRASVVLGIDEAGGDAVAGFLPVPASVESRVRLVEGRFSRSRVAAYGPFDGILCVDVLEHLADDKAFLADIASVSVSGARFLLHVPAVAQVHPVAWVRHELDRMLTEGTGQHVREGYSAAGLEELLAATGWRVLRTRPTFGPIAAWWCDADFYLAERGSRLLRGALLPATILGGVTATHWAPARGNGWLILAER